MGNAFLNYQLQRIAEGIEGGMAGGGTLTVDVTGAGDMQGATASTAGVHGLVPAPQAGDEDKFLTGAGTFERPAGGGVDYSLSEQDTGLKWIDGKKIYQKTISFTVAGEGYVSNPTGITGIDTLIKHEEIGRITDFVVNGTAYNNPPICTYSVAMMYAFQGGELYADYRATPEAVGATFYITVWYTKV